jgi:formylglycine-generating enzyme required for sulfatase activity
MGGGLRWLGSAGALCVGLGSPLAGCSDTAAARAQLRVVVDTDARVVGELSSHAGVSPDAAIDTLQVDLLDASNTPYESHTLVVSDPSTWPVSFGVQASDAGGGTVTLRLRAFRAIFAAAGTAQNGQATLDPAPEITIDRLAIVAMPSSGDQVAAVTLAEDCMGTAASFGGPLTTCIDAAHTAADPHDGVAASAPSSSRVGTWAAALDVPCTAHPTGDQVCIPGGFEILGERSDVGTTAGEVAQEPVPLRPAVVAPFLLDAHEFTVGRLRALVQANRFPASMEPATRDPNDMMNGAWCTWLGAGSAAADDLPVDCIDYEAAKLACALSGERLPTEVEWEFAARGRGHRLTFPWGDTFPQCCTASLSRVGPPDIPVQCAPAAGVEKVGSHPISAACGGTGDVTPLGVFDLGGSMGEATSTIFAAYGDPCWDSVGILRAPPCTSGSGAAGRGSDWNAGLETSFGAGRLVYANDANNGFRCAADGALP